MIKPQIALLWLYLPTPEHIIRVFGFRYADRWFGRLTEEFIKDHEYWMCQTHEQTYFV